MADKLVPIVIRMPAKLQREIRTQAKREERSMAQLMRHAIREYLNGTK